jgi:type III secretion protein C
MNLRIQLIAVASACALSAACHAAEPPWRTSVYRYNAIESIPLKDFLREFAASQSLTAVIDDKVEGTVRGKFEMPPANLMATMSSMHGLIWYYDGSLLHIQPASDATSQVVRLAHSRMDSLQKTLVKLNIADKRYPLVYDREENTAIVSGPKRYVELVQNAARSIDQNELARGTTDVRVFPLRYAWAADYRVGQGDSQVTVPGVATTLRNLFAKNRSGSGSSAAFDSSRKRTMVKLKGTDVRVPLLPELGDGQGGPQDGGGDGPFGTVLSTPQFEPDSRMNAVLVRDSPERMARYAELIKSLDVKAGLVEIEVTIMDVSTDFVESLGVDWRFSNGRVDLQTGRGGGPSPNFGTAVNPLSPPNDVVPRGALLTALGGNVGRFLVARVRALAEDGKANFIARPKIMTLDNVEALLENKSEFFVRVAGNQDVGLFNVVAGTALRVTPLIVDDASQRGVKLAIKIDDGDISDVLVDQIPVVRRRTIGTQAFVNEGESLLIAGYSVESDSQGDVGVPGLSKIPVLGYLFKSSEKKRNKVERLYMLTPRIVTAAGSALTGRDSAPRPSAPDAGAKRAVPAASEPSAKDAPTEQKK